MFFVSCEISCSDAILFVIYADYCFETNYLVISLPFIYLGYDRPKSVAHYINLSALPIYLAAYLNIILGQCPYTYFVGCLWMEYFVSITECTKFCINYFLFDLNFCL